METQRTAVFIHVRRRRRFNTFLRVLPSYTRGDDTLSSVKRPIYTLVKKNVVSALFDFCRFSFNTSFHQNVYIFFAIVVMLDLIWRALLVSVFDSHSLISVPIRFLLCFYPAPRLFLLTALKGGDMIGKDVIKSICLRKNCLCNCLKHSQQVNL